MSVPKPAARRASRWRAVLILACAVTVTAGCGAARPQAARPGGSAGDGAPAARAATPAVFVGTLVPTRSHAAWPVAVFSSATGQVVRWLTRPRGWVSDE